MSDDAPAPASPASWISDAKATLTRFVSVAEAFFVAHPDLQSDAAEALKATADAAAPLAEADVSKIAPTSVADVIDAAISKIKSDADAASAQIQAEAQAKIDALQSAKTTT